MKKLLVLLFVLFTIQVKAQIQIGDDTTNEIMIIKTDTMSVRESFALLKKLCKAGGYIWWDRKVIHKGKTYFKFGITLNKERTYIIEGRRMRRVTI